MEDLYRWNEALFSGKVLSGASFQAAFTPVHTKYDNTPRFEGYGYGWIIQKLRGLSEISHGGKLHGFSSYLLRIPTENLTAVVLENAMPYTVPKDTMLNPASPPGHDQTRSPQFGIAARLQPTPHSPWI